MVALLLAAYLAGQDWTGIAPKIDEGVVRVEATNGDVSFICSGTVIGDEYVLTVAHCIPEGASVAVNRKHAEIARLNRIIDLVVLRVEKLKNKPLPRRTAKVAIGLPVALAGYALGAPRPRYTFGYVSDLDDDVMVGLLVDAAIIPGHSGGPIVDEHGCLITIAQKWVGSQSSGFAVGVAPEVIADFASPFWPKEKK
jgi:S1-C subfamily serine protease